MNEKQRPDGEEEGRDVDDHDPAESDEPQKRTGENRSEDSRRVLGHGDEAVGPGVLLSRYHEGDRGSERRLLEGVEAAVERRGDEQVPDLEAVEPEQRQQRNGHHSSSQIAPDHHPLPIPAIDVDAGDRAEQDHREEAEDADECERRCPSGDLPRPDHQAEVGHVRPDEGDGLPEADRRDLGKTVDPLPFHSADLLACVLFGGCAIASRLGPAMARPAPRRCGRPGPASKD